MILFQGDAQSGMAIKCFKYRLACLEIFAYARWLDAAVVYTQHRTDSLLESSSAVV
jgi:hypothetical protein